MCSVNYTYNYSSCCKPMCPCAPESSSLITWLANLRCIYLIGEWWGVGVVICLERGADLHMAQLMPLPLTVSCFSKIQIGSTFLVPAHPGSPGKRAAKRVCVCVCVCNYSRVLRSVSLPFVAAVSAFFYSEFQSRWLGFHVCG